LRVPHHAHAPVARLAAGLAARFVAPGLYPPCLSELRRAQCLANRHLHRMELVVARHLLDEASAAVVLEDKEIPRHIEETPRGEYALDHHLPLGDVRVGKALAFDRAPRL